MTGRRSRSSGPRTGTARLAPSHLCFYVTGATNTSSVLAEVGAALYTRDQSGMHHLFATASVHCSFSQRGDISCVDRRFRRSLSERYRAVHQASNAKGPGYFDTFTLLSRFWFELRRVTSLVPTRQLQSPFTRHDLPGNDAFEKVWPREPPRIYANSRTPCSNRLHLHPSAGPLAGPPAPWAGPARPQTTRRALGDGTVSIG